MFSDKRYEARDWLVKNPNKVGFATNHFDTTADALAFVDRLYAAGAVTVEVGQVFEEEWRIEEEGGPYAATLYIVLPEDEDTRHNVKIAAFKACPDEGNITGNELRVWWD